MANYLPPPPFSNKWLQPPSNILENNWDCLSKTNTRKQQQEIKGEKKKVFANLHKVLEALSSTAKCQMGERFRIQFGIVLPELMMMQSNNSLGMYEEKV